MAQRGVRTVRLAEGTRGLISVALLALVTAAIALFIVHQDVNSFTLQTHGDQAWVQASAQVAMQTGPFATNDNVGWDSGFNPWTFPALGSVGFYLAAWLLGLITDSSSNVLAIIMAATASAVSVATYAALRLAAGRPVSRIVALTLALAMGLSPYVLTKMGHYNVGAFYLLPSVLAFIGYSRTNRSRRSLIIAAGLLAATAALSPLWWGLVSIYFLLAGVLVAAALRSTTWLKTLLLTAVPLVLGTVLPAALASVNKVGDEAWNRQQWDSTVYSGSLTDLLFASPFLTERFTALADLLPATSRELSQVGLVPGLAAAVAVVLAATAFLGFSAKRRASSGWLLVLLQLTLLTFLTLGLGTLVEALFALVHVSFPLRVWSRLIILIALIGVILLAPWVSERLSRVAGRRGTVITVVTAALVVGVVMADALTNTLSPPRAVPTLEELPAVGYLDTLDPACPTAQLPVGTFPDFPLNDGTERAISFYYRGFVPYLLRPDHKWSYGAAAGTSTDVLFRALPATLRAPDLSSLKAAGYCTILFDREYAQWLTERQVSWPGTAIEGLDPSWTGSRFDVYQLN